MNSGIEIAFIMVLLAVSAVAAPIASLGSGAGGEGVLLVIGPDAPEIIRKAGGQEVGPYRAFWGALASGDEDFSERAADVGAWSVRNAALLAAICR